MHRRSILKAFAGLALCPLCATAGVAAEGAHWSYEGAEGPAHWGDVDAASKVCSVGSQQSPIDITSSVRAELPPLAIDWKGGVDTIVNNGHTIQVNAADGSTLKVAGASYKLVQFHFHRPSEHLIDGKSFPMEVHFVHRNDAGALAVVGVLMTTGQANAAFKAVTAAMPQAAGPAVKAPAAIDPAGFLPAGRNYYRYAGSLTTPPCAETVEWLLLTTPVEVAEADVASFAKLYAMNARPVQKVNRRDVLRSG
ncbi:carbonic anhydrase [Bradyrhizobium sp. 2TAF24]|uniref:carbonic anhydrase n=1 Tax=Bradyrhizobium sp. 2TAF24 TaxID=3233011 RepID=UPI003F8FE5C8